MTDTDINIQLERHDQHIKSLQHQVDDLKQVQHEIKTMGETLVVLTTEIRHTNHSVNDLKQKVDVIESQPRARLNQIVTAIIAALAGGGISTGITLLCTHL